MAPKKPTRINVKDVELELPPVSRELIDASEAVTTEIAAEPELKAHVGRACTVCGNAVHVNVCPCCGKQLHDT